MKLFLNALILILLPVLLYSQTGKEVLTLNDCVRLALENNANLNNSQNLAEIARLSQTRSYSTILPRVDFSVNAGRSKSGDRTYVGEIILPDSTIIVGELTGPGYELSSYNSGLSVSQNIFDGGFWWNNIRQKKALNQAGKYDLKTTENFVIKSVSQYYYDLLKNLKLLEVYSLAVQRSQGQVDRTQSMFEIGSVAQVDVYRARVNLGQDQIRYLQQKNMVRQSQQILNLAMGLDPLNPLTIDTLVVFEPRVVSLDDLLNLAQTSQPELMSHEFNVKSKELGVALAKSNFWPSLGARFNYSRRNSDYNKVFIEDWDKNWEISYGIGLSWNLFNGFADRIDYQTSKLDLKNSKIAFEDYKRGLKSDVSNLYNDYNAIVEIVEINKKNLEAAREEFRLADERYRLGSGTSLELREAQVNLTEAEQILVAAEYNAIITYIDLSESVGKVREALNL